MVADMPYITTEEVADLLGLTPQDVYETRRRGAFPGVLGRRRGKRLMFDQAKVEAGDSGPQTTGDIDEAILWTLQGIEAKLGKMVDRPYLTLDEVLVILGYTREELAAYDDTTTTGDEEE